MSIKTRQNILKGVLLSLVVLVFLFLTLFINSNLKNKKLNDQINTQQELIDRYSEILNKEYHMNELILTIDDKVNNVTNVIKFYNIMDISIYDVLLLNGYTTDDFTSFDGENYYIGTKDSTKYVNTQVPELSGDEDFYDLEWGSLLVGLNKIIMKDNYTLVVTYFE